MLPMQRRLTSLSAMLGLLLGGCSEILGSGCELMVHRAIEVEVRDARTGAWVAAGATGQVQDGSYTEALVPVGWRSDTVTTLGAAVGRPGTYTVRVEHPAYLPWEQRDVRSRSDECGLLTRRLSARLTPRT